MAEYLEDTVRSGIEGKLSGFVITRFDFYLSVASVLHRSERIPRPRSKRRSAHFRFAAIKEIQAGSVVVRRAKDLTIPEVFNSATSIFGNGPEHFLVHRQRGGLNEARSRQPIISFLFSHSRSFGFTQPPIQFRVTSISSVSTALSNRIFARDVEHSSRARIGLRSRDHTRV